MKIISKCMFEQRFIVKLVKVFSFRHWIIAVRISKTFHGLVRQRVAGSSQKSSSTFGTTFTPHTSQIVKKPITPLLQHPRKEDNKLFKHQQGLHNFHRTSIRIAEGFQIDTNT